ncbi:MAG: hypothetical protein NTV46_19455, partial [Verrucomicrobia bacterium]|nr:hypothetical protein [Verrucomicrobiota bacterium]
INIIIVSIALLFGCGVATYKESVQIDLGSGVLRKERKSLWMTIYRSSPQQTTISQALGGSIQPSRWLTIWEQGFSLLPRIISKPSYPRYMFWVGRIGEEFSNHKVAAITAKMTLNELEKTNPGVLTRHLERFWNELVDEFDDSWDDSAIESEIPRIWQKATINKPRHATSRPVSEIPPMTNDQSR